MPRYVALLRAINVGGHTVKMEPLRKLFEGLKFSNVSTYIASGNVVFETPGLDPSSIELKIEKHLKHALGYEVTTFLRTPAQLTAIVESPPFSPEELAVPGHALYVNFLRNPLSAEVTEQLLAFRTEFDEFRTHGIEYYWLSRGKISESKVSLDLLAKAIGQPSTSRNITTVRKLAQK